MLLILTTSMKHDAIVGQGYVGTDYTDLTSPTKMSIEFRFTKG